MASTLHLNLIGDVHHISYFDKGLKLSRLSIVGQSPKAFIKS